MRVWLAEGVAFRVGAIRIMEHGLSVIANRLIHSSTAATRRVNSVNPDAPAAPGFLTSAGTDYIR